MGVRIRDRFVQTSRENHVYFALRRQLQTGELQPGDRLSTRALAQDLNVSAMPVRSALARLVSEGLVRRIAQVGHVVREVDDDSIEELREFRCLIEGFAADRCARRISRQDLGAMEDLVEEMRDVARAARRYERIAVKDHPLRRRLCEIDERFHHVLIRAAGNRWADRAAANLNVLSEMFAQKQPVSGRTMLRHAAHIYRSHRRIVRAIARGKPALARLLVHRHIKGGGLVESNSPHQTLNRTPDAVVGTEL